MKLRMISLAAISVLSATALANQPMSSNSANATAASEQAVSQDEASYALGYALGRNMRSQSVELQMDQFMQGMKASMTGQQPKYDQQKMMETLRKYQASLASKQAERRQMQAQKNKQEGDAFLAANKKKPGVVELPSGLQYKVITQGKGATPTMNDSVKVNYQGSFINGEVFASNQDENNADVLRLAQMIPGWQEALQKMKVGATWELYIPARLAYGTQGAHEQIEPNSTLIFRISLRGLVPQQAAS